MVIDFHCHLFPPAPDDQLVAQAERLARMVAGYGIRARSPQEVAAVMAPLLRDGSGESIIGAMDEGNIDVSVCFPVDNVAEGLDDSALLQRNKNCAELARRFPGRIVPFASVDPRRKAAARLLRECVEEMGMRGLKWHPDLGYRPTGREAYRVLEVAQECGIILLTHTGPLTPPRRNRYAHPLFLDDVSNDFPELKIVAAHSGGLWLNDWCAVAAFNDNMWGDLAMWQLDAEARYSKFCQNLRQLLDVAGPHKLLFASDWPAFEAFVPTSTWVDMLRRLPQEATGGIRFSAEEVDAILGGNARRLLRL